MSSDKNVKKLEAKMADIALKNKNKKKVEEEEDDPEEEGEEEEEEDDGDDEGDEDFGEMMEAPKPIRNRVIALMKLHEEQEQLMEAYKAERLALEQKYVALKVPLAQRRFGITQGDVEVEDISEEDPEGEAKEKTPEEIAAEEKAASIVGIPGFWCQCICQHPGINGALEEEDQLALDSLIDVKVEYNEDMSSFTLIFVFKENEYFTNTELTKSYTVVPDLIDDRAPKLTDVKGCEINWKPKKNLCVKEITKKQKAKSGKRKGEVRTITKQIPKASFFHFFSEPKQEDDEDEDDKEEDKKKDDEEENVQFTVDEDYDIAHAIRTSLVPEAVLWFTGEGEYEDFDDEDDFEEEDDEDDEDDEGEDDDDEEEPVRKPQRSKASKKTAAASGPGGATGGEKPPECKQN